MLAANPTYFTREHYTSVTGLADPALTELVVHCLELVSQLGVSGIPFRFKGGNSLLLLLDQPERFSIDVDIVTTVSREALIEAVETIAGTGGCPRFTGCEIRPHKTKPWLPMISFKLFFESLWQKPEDAFVMLDAVLEEAPYPGIRQRVVCSDIYASDVHVEIPSRSGLIADKLLTLGPSTLGIPLGKGKEAQRLKHVFDVASLARGEWDPELSAQAIGNCIVQESRIQKKTLSFAEIRDDTMLFLGQAGAAALCATEPPPPEDAALPIRYCHEIATGFEPFCKHLFRTRYTWNRLAEDCGLVMDVLRGIRPD
ncbi:MAG TPA: nucleotidyl transferase AbiEii/AbiGii toxin family protein [Spirochaetota bacterium]|nr:nucleotidyl transferase AbiEii/AbiGii toxin family protein [Spirochaetota bacterium]